MENKFIRADDVAQELSVSKPYIFMKGSTEQERRVNNASIQK